MKIAIIGAISPNLSFKRWTNLINRHVDVSALTGINITAGDNLLNSYSEKLADSCSIPIKRFEVDTEAHGEIAKAFRNHRLIEDSDLVVALTKSSPTTELQCFNCNVPAGLSKKAMVIVTNIDNKTKRNPDDRPTEVTSDQLITIKEEIELAMQIQRAEGDVEAAKAKLLYCSQRFVRAIALKYVSPQHSLNQLIAEGNKGLISAAHKYDPSTGFKFISYATPYIHQSIKNYIKSETTHA